VEVRQPTGYRRASMTPKTKKSVGSVLAGCGCLVLLVLSAWLCFVIYVGLQGRGNDTEVSLVLGAVTCGVSLPVLVLTIVGLVLALRKVAPEARAGGPSDP